MIKESLRVAHGVVHPLPRVVGPTDTNIGGFSVPAGVCAFVRRYFMRLTCVQAVVSMSATFVHHDANIFPDPHVFRPERWLNTTKDLDQHLVSFSKGPRMCIGLKYVSLTYLLRAELTILY